MNHSDHPESNNTVQSLAEDTRNAQQNTKESKRELVGNLELLEERAVVNKERLDIGKINVSKQVRTKTVNIPIELAEEVLVIETEYFDPDSKEFLNRDANNSELIRLIEPTLQNKASITVNGTEVSLEDGPVEVLISRQVAVIKKETYAVQDIAIEKSTHIHKDSFDVELRHEELDIDEKGFLDQQTRLHED